MRNAGLMDLLFPRGVLCASCRKAGFMDGQNVLCPNCRAAHEEERVPAASCERCLGHVPADGKCPLCASGALDGIQKAYAPYRYMRVARRMVTQLKFRYNDDVLPDMCADMAASLNGQRFDALVPVPLHKTRQRERGCNQAMKLAEGVAARTGMPVADVLLRTRATRPQSALRGEKDRRSNVADAFKVKADACICGKRLLLVDDVRTSGSTARACAKALLLAGAKQVDLLTYSVVWEYRGKKHGSVAGKNGAAHRQ